MFTFWLCSACAGVGAIIGDLVASLCGYGTWCISFDVFSDMITTVSTNPPGIGEIIGCIFLLLVLLAIIGIAVILFIGGIIYTPKCAWFILVGAIIAFVAEAFPTEFDMAVLILGGIIAAIAVMFGTEVVGFIDDWGFFHIFKK